MERTNKMPLELEESMEDVKDFPHRALFLAEFLRQIFNNQENTPKDLYSCSLVCKQWSELALEALWRDRAPDIHTLIRLHECGSLEKYISAVRHLQFRCEACHYSYAGEGFCDVEKSVHFMNNLATLYPQFRVVSLNVKIWVENHVADYFTSLFQPPLRAVVFTQVSDAIPLLKLLSLRSPYLKDVHIGRGSSASISDDDNDKICEFISNLPQLRRFTGLLHKISNPTVCQIMNHPSLEELIIDGFRSPDWLDVVLNTTSDWTLLCPAVRSLKITGENVSDAQLVSMLSSGVFKDLQILDWNSSRSSCRSAPFSLLSNYPQLAFVNLTLHPEDGQNFRLERDVSPQIIIPFIRTCQNLSLLQVKYQRPYDVLEVTRAEVCVVFELLPCIKHLNLPWKCALGNRELEILAKLCPRLTSLQLEDSTLSYTELMNFHLEMPNVINFLDCKEYRRAHWEPLLLPHPSLGEPPISKGQQAVIFRRLLPGVFKDLPKLRHGHGDWT